MSHRDPCLKRNSGLDVIGEKMPFSLVISPYIKSELPAAELGRSDCPRMSFVGCIIHNQLNYFLRFACEYP